MRRTSHREAVDAIAGWIVGGRHGSGAVLPTEPVMAAELGVSRTTVREAIKTLVAKGMLVAGPRVGTRVQPRERWHALDPDVVGWQLRTGVEAEFVRDLIELRLAIEPMAARCAAERRTSGDLLRLDERLAIMRAGLEGRADWLEGDLGFHRTILLASRNRFLVGMLPLVTALLTMSFNLSVKSRESARQSIPLHEAVRDAVAAREAERAEAAMRTLILSAWRDIEGDLERDDFLCAGKPRGAAA